MAPVHEGQCGLCEHFGGGSAGSGSASQQLVQIRVRGEAPEGYVDGCGHPQHASLDLRVSAISGCRGFSPAQG